MPPLDLVKNNLPETFGSARFLTVYDAGRAGLLQEGRDKNLAPFLGHIVDSDRYVTEGAYPIFARTVRAAPMNEAAPPIGESVGHLLTVAPTRAGKGTGQIVPNLLQYDGSVFVIDIKGENYACTSGSRSSGTMRQTVHRFAPFEISEADRTGHAVWNPIMAIGIARPEYDEETQAFHPREATASELEEDTRYLVNLLLVPSGGSENLFFENSARNFLAGLLLYIRTASIGYQHPTAFRIRPKPYDVCERSMREVRRLIALPKEDFEQLLKAMAKSKLSIVKHAATSMSKMSSGDSRVGTSVLAFAEEQTQLWDYKRVHAATYEGSKESAEPAPNHFNFRDLAFTPTSIYVIIPPDEMVEYRVLFRVMIGCALREQRLWYHAAPKDQPPVLYMLDEFPQLARMKPIEEGLLYLAGYGIRLWFFIQDISQLQLHYPDSWRTFMANTGTQCFFGVSDIQTANLVSEMAGTITVTNRGYGFNMQWGTTEGTSRTTGTSRTSGWGPGGSSGSNTTSDSFTESWGSSMSQGTSTNISYVGRRLIMPDEVMRMHDEEQIIFIKSTPPIRAAKMPYYKVKRLNEMTKILPPYSVKFK
jgi:type IV secretion system protein VirD4